MAVYLLAHPSGFEPETSASGGQRSIQLSYGCATVGIVLCLLALVQPQNRWFFGFIKIYQSISQNLSNPRKSRV